MLDRLLTEVKAKGKVCHKVKLQLRFPSGSFQERKLSLKQGTNSKTVIMARLTDWLESISLPEPATEMELSVEIGPEQGQKLYLLPQ